MHGLSIRDPNYAALYVECMQRFPDVVKQLAGPVFCQIPTSSFAFQTPATQPWTQPVPTLAQQPWQQSAPPPPAPVPSHQQWNQPTQPIMPPSDATSFFRIPQRMNGCAFCTQPNHGIRKCPIAMEYVRMDCTKVINDRLHLPNGQRIPNDGSNRGLKHGINTWFASGSSPAPTSTTSSNAIPLQHEPPSQLALSFEAMESHMVQLTNVSELEPEPATTSDDLAADLYDLHEVLAMEWKKREHRQPAARSPPSSAPASTTLPSTIPVSWPPQTAAHSTPQFRYKSSAENLELTSQLFGMLWDSKLDQTTPAHASGKTPCASDK